LEKARAGDVSAVGVVNFWDAALRGGVAEGVEQFPVKPLLLDALLTICAMKFIGPAK
jgi:hypothetical protein